jgi:hypothetical protein
MPGTTPIYGFPYPEPTDLVADYPALGQQLAEDIEAALPGVPGLIGSPPTSLTNTGGTATLTDNTVSFSAVSALSLNGCFSSTYEDYRIIIKGNSSVTGSIAYRLRVAGADDTTNNYWYQYLLADNTTVSAGRAQGTSAFWINTHTTRFMAVIDVFGPNMTIPTLQTVLNTYNAAAPQALINTETHNVSTAYTSISLLPPSGTITGTVAVYGYQK